MSNRKYFILLYYIHYIIERLLFWTGDFSLDPHTAMIKTRKNLERQQTFSYNLTIGVSDQGKPARIATVNIDYR